MEKDGSNHIQMRRAITTQWDECSDVDDAVEIGNRPNITTAIDEKEREPAEDSHRHYGMSEHFGPSQKVAEDFAGTRLTQGSGDRINHIADSETMVGAIEPFARAG